MAMVSVVMLLSLSAAPSSDALARAKEAENRGFTHVEAERWCEAMHAFSDANRAAPSVDLIYNAALAAEFADDRQRALLLFAELVGAYPDSKQKAEVSEKIVALTMRIQKDGAGVACAAAVAPDEAAIADDAPTTTSTTTAPKSDVVDDDSSNFNVLPWATLGTGAVVFVGGALLLTLGLVPLVGHMQARTAILDAEKAGDDAAEAQLAQSMWRGAWETWGIASTVGGILIGAVGAAALTGGGIWGVVAMTSGAPDGADVAVVDADAE